MFLEMLLKMFLILFDILFSSAKELSCCNFCVSRALASVERAGDSSKRCTGCFGLVIGFDNFRAEPFFTDKFDRGDKEIEIVMPLGSVEGVKLGNEFRMLEAFVAEGLSDMSPVFVFDMSVVVFVVGRERLNCTGCIRSVK